MSQIQKLHQASVVSFPELDYEPLVPEGEYRLKLLSHSTAIMFRAPRLILRFSIVDFGEAHEYELSRYYSVEKLIGKDGNRGKCKHKRRGDFMLEYFTLFPDRPRTRLDRIPLEPLYNSIVIGKVRTVKVNNQQKELPRALWHSVIGQLVGVEQ